MTSKNLLNIFLALALAGLLALVIYEPGKTEAPAVKKITLLSPDAVQKISIESPARTPLLFTKNSGQWQMQSPLKMPANAGRIQQLLKVLQATSIARYALNQVDASQMELDAPSLTLKFDDVLLRFGGTDALGGSRYVQVGDTVHLLMDRYSYLAKGDATDFVSPALLPELLPELLPKSSAITELVLPGLHLTQQDGRWRVDGKSGDADAVQTLLDEWRHARALQVSELNKTPMQLIMTESVSVTIGKDANKKVVQFALLRNETDIILQRHELGIQYHFPLEASQRLLGLVVTDAESTP